jgi:hypothetical protein
VGTCVKWVVQRRSAQRDAIERVPTGAGAHPRPARAEELVGKLPGGSQPDCRCALQTRNDAEVPPAGAEVVYALRAKAHACKGARRARMLLYRAVLRC